MLEPATKICFCCKEEKPVSDFSVRKDRGTLLSYCKPCTSKKTSEGKKRRRALNPKPPKTGVSQETRDKISKARSKWLAENPDKHPWRKQGDAKFKSVPCEKMKEFLTSKGLTFAAEYQPEVGGRHFSIDIAFPDKKIAIEVNGTQHYERDGKLKPYYQERHDILEANGWQVYEVYYSMCYNLEKWEHMIPTILAVDKKVEFDYLKYVPRQKKTICCKFCGKETVNYKVYCNKECRESYKITNAAPSKEYEERVSSIISSNKSGARACPNCGGAKSMGLIYAPNVTQNERPANQKCQVRKNSYP